MGSTYIELLRSSNMSLPMTISAARVCQGVSRGVSVTMLELMQRQASQLTLSLFQEARNLLRVWQIAPELIGNYSENSICCYADWLRRLLQRVLNNGSVLGFADQ